MTLTPEQKQSVAQWVAAGDNLAAIQKKLSEQFKISLTYRDVRFLVDDLNLELKDTTPRIDTSDVTKAQPRPSPAEKPEKGLLEKAKEKLGLGRSEPAEPPEEELEEDDYEDLPEPGGSKVKVALDSVTLIPGALATGTVTFSDGVTGKWIIDEDRRLGFTELSKPKYAPTPADGQAFMQELNRAIRARGY